MQAWLPWAMFAALIAVMLVIDLLVVHRKAREISFREAAVSSVAWVGVSLVFCFIIYLWKGPVPAGEFLAGYLVEEALSADNMFVFLLIFSYFKVPSAYQHRVLYWGIVGAVIMRGIFIAAGVGLLETFEWLIYVFGAFLVFTGVRFAKQEEVTLDPERNLGLRLLRKIMPITKDFEGQRLFIRQGGKILATPLFAVLLVVETTDLVFALDSIPAIFGITTDPFIIFTSNIFAVMGLRSLYFLLAGLANRFVYLRVGLAVVLVFIGAKMMLEWWIHIPLWVSLAVVVGTIATSVAISVRVTSPEEPLDSRGL